MIAALLHDSIEDQKVPREIIADTFGEDVTKLVEEVTDDKSLEKQERKRLQVENARLKSDRAKIMKLADKISNLRDIAANPPSGWSVKRRLEYVQWARDVVDGLKGVSPRLEDAFERAAEDAETAIAPRQHLSDQSKK